MTRKVLLRSKQSRRWASIFSFSSPLQAGPFSDHIAKTRRPIGRRNSHDEPKEKIWHWRLSVVLPGATRAPREDPKRRQNKRRTLQNMARKSRTTLQKKAKQRGNTTEEGKNKTKFLAPFRRPPSHGENHTKMGFLDAKGFFQGGLQKGFSSCRVPLQAPSQNSCRTSSLFSNLPSAPESQ